MIILYSSFAVFIGWLIQGFIGFGSGIVSTFLLVFLFNMKEIIVSLSVTALVGTFLLAVKSYKGNWYLNQTLPISILSLLGIFIGSYLLSSLNLRVVEFIFGVVVLLTGIYDFLYQKGVIKSILIRNKKIFLVFTGIVGGLMSGLIGASGPIHVLYFNQVIDNKEHYKFVVSFIFTVLNVERIIFYLLSGDLNTSFNSDIILYGIPATVAGMYIGDSLSKKVSTDSFKKLVSIAITLSGVFFIVKAMF